MMKRIMLSCLLLLGGLTQAVAEPVVVVSANSRLGALTQDEVRQIFNGQIRRVSGAPVTPLDLPSRDDARADFYQQVLGKSAEQMKSYWARMIFTGRGMPPREVSSEREMLMLVGSDRDFVGYLDASRVTPDLKVVYRP
ncbi:MAG: hypothetical protein VX793_12040 [Pseudomonadota bacterium]|nr:hypothetical protein [Pseudomonadota bacterium]